MPDPTDTETLAEVLAQHQIEGGKGFAESFFGCTCDGWLNDSDYTHAEHVAEVLAPIIAARIVQARAVWPCGNYRSPLTCLTAPATTTGRCDFCAVQARAGEGALREAALAGRRATLDPGAFVKRERDQDGDYERLDRWQERALLAAVAALDTAGDPT